MKLHLADATAAIDDAKARLDRQARECTALEQELARVGAELQQTRAHAETTSRSLDFAKAETESAAVRHQREAEALAARHQAVAAALRVDAAQLEQKAAVMATRLGDERESHFTTQRECQDLAARCAALQADAEAKGDSLAEATAAARDMVARIAALQTEGAQAREEAGLAAAAAARLEAQLHAQREQHDAAAAELRSLLDEKEKVVEALRGDFDQSVRTLEAAVAAKAAVAADLQVRLAALGDEHASRGRSMREVSEQLLQRSEELAAARRDVADRRAAVLALQQSVVAAGEEAKDARAASERAAAQMQQNIQALEETKAHLQEDVSCCCFVFFWQSLLGQTMKTRFLSFYFFTFLG